MALVSGIISITFDLISIAVSPLFICLERIDDTSGSIGTLTTGSIVTEKMALLTFTFAWFLRDNQFC